MKFILITLYRLTKKIVFYLGYKLEIKKKNSFTFLNLYKSYQEALKASKNETTYITKNYQSSFELLDLNDVEVADKFNILPLFFAFTHEKNEDNNLFLEIGGGHLPIFLYILKSIGQKYKFQILEEQNFKVQIPQEYEDYLKYTYKLEDMKFKDSKVVIFSGSIQYIENYMEILEKIFSNKVKNVFITETMFTNKSEDTFTLQNNMLNVKFPNIFISFKKFNKLFDENNYELVFQTKRKVGKYSHNILNKGEFFVKDLVYKLKEQT